MADTANTLMASLDKGIRSRSDARDIILVEAAVIVGAGSGRIAALRGMAVIDTGSLVAAKLIWLCCATGAGMRGGVSAAVARFGWGAAAGGASGLAGIPLL